MKEIAKTMIVYIFIGFFVYLCFAYALMDIDANIWGTPVRVGQLFISCLGCFIYSVIKHTTKPELK